jgi:hypothetical protein
VPTWSPLNLTVSPHAHDGWSAFAAAHGATMSALAEALGRRLAILDDPESELPQFVQDILRDARRIAAERTSRRP